MIQDVFLYKITHLFTVWETAAFQRFLLILIKMSVCVFNILRQKGPRSHLIEILAVL